jgi:hypothetical protein
MSLKQAYAEADAKAAADKAKNNAPADQKIIENLAQLNALAYAKRRTHEAKALNIPVAALDKLVRHIQAQSAEHDAELPH